MTRIGFRGLRLRGPRNVPNESLAGRRDDAADEQRVPGTQVSRRKRVQEPESSVCIEGENRLIAKEKVKKGVDG